MRLNVLNIGWGRLRIPLEFGRNDERGQLAAGGITIHRKVVNFSFSLATDALD
jgi:hypothetical protein